MKKSEEDGLERDEMVRKGKRREGRGEGGEEGEEGWGEKSEKSRCR